MSRKKKSATTNTNIQDINLDNVGKIIAEEIDSIITEKYGEYIDNESELIPFNIKPLDAVLGGGLLIGNNIMLSGPAEIGKTTISWQIIKNLLDKDNLATALYIDVEGSANTKNDTYGIKSRTETMNIDTRRVIYKSMTLTVEKTFDLIIDAVNTKRRIEEKFNRKSPMVIVWDSIADTPPGKIEKVDDPTKMTGYKARLVQFLLDKHKPLFRSNRVTLLLIDQIRSNISDSMQMYQKQETDISQINNIKTATGAKAVEHKIRQWIFLTKGPEIYDKEGVLGWYLNINVIKSKLSPSGFDIQVVFDKRYGINKFWTEYHFISELAPFEMKIYRKLGGANNARAKEFRNEIESILGVQTAGSYKYLQYIDPKTGEIIQSKKFYEKNAKELYETDEEFREFFDKVVDQQVKERIIKWFNPSPTDLNVKELLKEEQQELLTQHGIQVDNTIEDNDNYEDEDPDLISVFGG